MQDLWLFFGFWISDVLPGGQTLILFKGFGIGYWISAFGILASLYQSINSTNIELNPLICNRIIAAL